jgi:long-chain fatty acid transport protein
MTRRTLCFVPAPFIASLIAMSLAPQATAAGFQLREQSPSAQGTAFAGISAGGSDIGSMFFNPATMTLFSDQQVVLGSSYVMPNTRLENGFATRADGSMIFGPSSTNNAAQSAALPNLYGMWSVTPNLKLGLSVNAPFGLSTDYDADFIGRYHGLKSDLKVIDIAPNIAYRINPKWSIGAAFVARHADAELSEALDFGTLLGAPGVLDGTATLKGSRWGYGYRVGVLFQPTDALRFGLAHQSAINMNLKGDASFQFNALTPAIAQIGLTLSGFSNGGATAELNLPATTSLGMDFKVSDKVTLQAEIARTDWSTFDELRVKFNSGLPDAVTTEHWRNTWFYSLGLSWQATDAWTLRTGIAHDESAVDDAFRTPRIPDGDRTWVALGAGYAFSKQVSLDFAYTHLFVKSSPIELQAFESGYLPLASPNLLRGNLNGSYKSSIDIIAAQLKFSF